MTVVWTPPSHVAGGTSLPVSQYDLEVVDNIQFLHDGAALFVGTPEDMTQTLLPGSANRAFVCPFVPRDVITVAGLTYRSQTVAGNIDVGVYGDDGNGTTATKLKTSGSVAMPAGSGAKTVNFTASQQLEPMTKYWFAIAFSNTSARVLGTDGPYSLLCKQMDTALPLPTTITFAALSGGISPCLVGLA